MPSKSGRHRSRRGGQRRRVEPIARTTVAGPAAAAATSGAPVSKSLSKGVVTGKLSSKVPHYGYVFHDLKRIGLVAGSIVVLIVVLSLIIG